jgi:hypothetical protein
VKRSALSTRPTIDVGRRMMAFNWLPAGYAHTDWLGGWADVLGDRGAVSMRTIQRASVMLLTRYDLRQRYLRDVGRHPWLLYPQQHVNIIAKGLGTAMLGDWVKTRLERAEVSLQHLVLGTLGRQEALRYAHELKALPKMTRESFWPEAPAKRDAVTHLGLSCMASLLDDVNAGARERFTLRFAYGTFIDLRLSPPQTKEAAAVIEVISDAEGFSS